MSCDSFQFLIRIDFGKIHVQFGESRLQCYCNFPSLPGQNQGEIFSDPRPLCYYCKQLANAYYHLQNLQTSWECCPICVIPFCWNLFWEDGRGRKRERDFTPFFFILPLSNVILCLSQDAYPFILIPLNSQFFSVRISRLNLCQSLFNESVALQFFQFHLSSCHSTNLPYFISFFKKICIFFLLLAGICIILY